MSIFLKKFITSIRAIYISGVVLSVILWIFPYDYNIELWIPIIIIFPIIILFDSYVRSIEAKIDDNKIIEFPKYKKIPEILVDEEQNFSYIFFEDKQNIAPTSLTHCTIYSKTDALIKICGCELTHKNDKNLIQVKVENIYIQNIKDRYIANETIILKPF